MTESAAHRWSRAQAHTIWMLWITYGSFYFCRTNIAAAVPGVMAEFHLDRTQIGLILGSLKLCYGIGQFVNGQLAERISSRKLLAIGMLASASLNVLFGFGTGLYFLLFVWACNGYSQALGWTPAMRVAANWFVTERRGRAIGIIGTGYQATAVATYVIAGYSAQWLGWRGALYVPAALLTLSAIHTLLFLREVPIDGPAEPTARAHDSPATQRWYRNVLTVIGNRRLWLLALALGLLNACRYGFLDWGITHLMEVQGGGIGQSALKYAVLPLGGIAGAAAAGWATDRWFDGRRVPVIFGLLITLGGFALLYQSVVSISLVGSVVLLALIGFTIYGPQVLLVGTAPIDLAPGGAPAASVGLVNFVGYLGAFSGDQVTGYLADTHGWNAALGFWAGCAFAGAVVVAPLWNAAAERR